MCFVYPEVNERILKLATEGMAPRATLIEDLNPRLANPFFFLLPSGYTQRNFLNYQIHFFGHIKTK